MARTAAIRRLTYNGLRFRDNALLAAQNAAQALAIINEYNAVRIRDARRPPPQQSPPY
jgi:hypothetical protein